MSDWKLNRRSLLKTSAQCGAGLSCPAVWTLVARPGLKNDTLRVAVIGPGTRGTQLMRECMLHGKTYNAKVTAVCDTWSIRREVAAATLRNDYGTNPKVYHRVEEVLADKEIDAVIIATPDHQHAKMLKMTIEAGKDVYCEKPMANELEEANEVLKAVKNSDLIVQIGAQRRSDPKMVQAAKFIAAGAIGKIVKVDLFDNVYKPYHWAKSQEELNSVQAKDVDWPAFLMGKPHRPFDPRIYRSFYLFRDFTNGIIGGWMSHAIDIVHMFTGQPYPNSAVAHGGIYAWKDYRENPDTVQVLLEYGEGDQRFLVNYTSSLINDAVQGWLFMGTRGTLEVLSEWRVSGRGSGGPAAIKEAQPITDAPKVLHHMANWLDCVRRREQKGLACPVEAGYGHSVACILGTEAYWNGRRMVFDSKRRTIQPG
jgi:predicted dehydrogenase